MIRPRRDCTRVDQSSGLFSFPIADTPLGRTKTAIGSHRADAQIDKSMAASRRSGRARTPSKCSSRCFETTSSGSFRSTGAANPLAAKLIVCFRFLCASLRFEPSSKAPSGRESRVQLIKASGRRWMIIARNNARKYPRSGWLWRGRKSTAIVRLAGATSVHQQGRASGLFFLEKTFQTSHSLGEDFSIGQRRANRRVITLFRPAVRVPVSSLRATVRV